MNEKQQDQNPIILEPINAMTFQGFVKSKQNNKTGEI